MDYSLISIPILIIITTVFTCLQANESVYYLKKEVNKESGVHFFIFSFSIISILMFFLLSGFKIKVSLYSFIFGLLFGASTMLFTYFQKKASTIGPWSYTNVIISLSTVFTALSGFLFFDEKITFIKIIGIILMLFCFAFANKKDSDDDNKKGNMKWFIITILAMLFSVAIGYIQKIHQSSNYSAELYCFLITAFTFMAILSFIMFLIERKKENKKNLEMKEMNKKTILFFAFSVIIAGVGTAFENTINLYLSGVMSSIVFFPLINGIPLIVSILVSFIIFKEKLSKFQWIGLSLGLISILLLCL